MLWYLIQLVKSELTSSFHELSDATIPVISNAILLQTICHALLSLLRILEAGKHASLHLLVRSLGNLLTLSTVLGFLSLL